MGFLDKIKKQTAAAPDEGNDEEQGILPEDAPSRETSDEEAEELTSKGKKKKTAKKPKAKAKPKTKKEEPAEEPPADGEGEAEPPKKKRGRPAGSKNKKKTADGFALFVDCMPMKGGEPYIMFEDWIAPIVEQLNSDCQDTMGKPNFWLLGFGEQKAAIATAISGAVKSLDGNLVVMSSDTYARDVIPLLVPHAAMVVRSLRG